MDPVFQFPENTQSLNPYSYVLNNPLSLTDPSGYCGETSGNDVDCGDNPVNNSSDDTKQQNADHEGTDPESRAARSNARHEARGGDTVEFGDVLASGPGAGNESNGESSGQSSDSTSSEGAIDEEGDVKNRGAISVERFKGDEETRNVILSEINEATQDIVGAEFDTQEAAAEAIRDSVNDISKKYDIEIGANFFPADGDKVVVGTVVTDFKSGDVDINRSIHPGNAEAIAIADFHTHGVLRSGLSDNDLEGNFGARINGFVSDGAGRLQKFDFQKVSHLPPDSSGEQIRSAPGATCFVFDGSC